MRRTIRIVACISTLAGLATGCSTGRHVAAARAFRSTPSEPMSTHRAAPPAVAAPAPPIRVLAASPSSAVTVTARNLRFDPATLSVEAGATVTWVNADAGMPCTSTSDDGIWDSSTIDGGGSFSHTFPTPGTYAYHCTFHQGMGMDGTVVVR